MGGSPRDEESSTIRSAREPGAVARVQLLDRLHVEAQVLVSHVALLVDGVADLFDAAKSREFAVNVPAVSSVARSLVESAGLAAWLLDDQIDGVERGRRYLTWVLNDLQAQRLLVDMFRPSPEDAANLGGSFDRTEKDLLSVAAKARWTTRPSELHGTRRPAVLLNDAGKQEVVPRYEELTGMVSSTPSLYRWLSASSHGARFGMLHGVQIDESGDRAGLSVAISGFGLEPAHAIGVTAVALSRAVKNLGWWTGTPTTRFDQQARRVMLRTGLKV